MANDRIGLTSDELAAVRHLLDRHGVREGSRKLELAPATAARLLAQLPVARTTLSHVRLQLAQLSGGEAA